MPHPRPSWPRRLRRLCLFLLLGLMTTVGVAMTAEALSNDEYIHIETLGRSSPDDWPTKPPQDWPRPETLMTYSGVGRTRAYVLSSDGKPMQYGEPRWIQVEWRLGWPMASLHRFEASVEINGKVVERPHMSLLYTGLPLPSWVPEDTTGPRSLPLLPIWPGLAFNTLFYALLWWLALASVRIVNHNRRYRHGLCPLCRYDLRADYSHGCSECGWGR